MRNGLTTIHIPHRVFTALMKADITNWVLWYLKKGFKHDIASKMLKDDEGILWRIDIPTKTLKVVQQL